jgi:NAD(P)-dependent dehydrogenase (short-subunit alcohol dehydrogenase family)
VRSLSELSNLTGQIALVTGAAGHVGRCSAAALAELGCGVCLLDLPGSSVESVAHEISRRHSVPAWALMVDLEDAKSRSIIGEMVKTKAGRLDILINSAALVGDSKLEGWAAPFAEQSLNTMRRCLEVNLVSVFDLVQQLEPILATGGNGRIVNIGSIYGDLGPDWRLYKATKMANPAAYAMSKAGLNQMTRWLATTLAPKVRANCIALGGLLRNQPTVFTRRYAERTPMQRMGTEDDIRGAIIFLSTDLSCYITGQVINVDGGFSAW